MRRGDIVLVADRSGGDYAGKPRPAVIVQSDLFDLTRSVTLCLMTTQLTGAPLLRVPVGPGERSGLRAESHIQIDKLTTIRRERVGAQIGRLSEEENLSLNRGLAAFLGFG